MAMSKEEMMGDAGIKQGEKIGLHTREERWRNVRRQWCQVRPQEVTQPLLPSKDEKKSQQSVNRQNTEFCGTGTGGPMDSVGQAAGFRCSRWSRQTHLWQVLTKPTLGRMAQLRTAVKVERGVPTAWAAEYPEQPSLAPN